MNLAKVREQWRIVLLVVILLGLGGWKFLAMFSNVGYSPAQPIPFSHKLHAGINHIPCQYCHAGVERASQSPIPGLNVCMGCHSVVDNQKPVIQEIAKAYNSNQPFHWVRLYHVPEFVKFRHSPHIDAGIACQTCHGPIQSMDQVVETHQFAMGECINCHRQQDHLPPAAERIHRDYQLSVFHGHPVNAPTDCNTCHN